jgi:elongation factor P
MAVIILHYQDEPISVQLPETVVLQVVEADAVVKGQTASSSYKPAKLSNGRRVMVPPFIESGTLVVVNTATGEYMKRAEQQ